MALLKRGPFGIAIISAPGPCDTTTTWQLMYGHEVLATRTLPTGVDVAEAFSEEIEDFIATAKAALSPVPPEAPRAWIAALLPPSILTADRDAWQVPNAWHLSHIIGGMSLTGNGFSETAKLCGVASATVRRWVIPAAAPGHKSIPFANWHILLHKLGVQRLG